ncbi:MAG: hypothetical protein UMV23_02675, partial [Halanaerobium sp.]|nr:hypothetical protein [Halanaerobium sp.]
NAPVSMVVIKFTSRDEAESLFEKISREWEKNHLVVSKFATNLHSFYSVWSGRTGGRRIVAWVQKGWIVVFTGREDGMVNTLADDFKDYIKQANKVRG